LSIDDALEVVLGGIVGVVEGGTIREACLRWVPSVVTRLYGGGGLLQVERFLREGRVAIRHTETVEEDEVHWRESRQ